MGRISTGIGLVSNIDYKSIIDQLMTLAKQMQAANPLLNGSLNPAPQATESSGPRTLGQQAADTWTATMGRLFETGREMQDQQLAQLEKLFTQLGAPPKA